MFRQFVLKLQVSIENVLPQNTIKNQIEKVFVQIENVFVNNFANFIAFKSKFTQYREKKLINS